MLKVCYYGDNYPAREVDAEVYRHATEQLMLNNEDCSRAVETKSYPFGTRSHHATFLEGGTFAY